MTTLIFVHGWGVTDTSSYGELPQRLQQRAASAGVPITIADLWLSEYVSFDDRLGMDDLVRGFDHALRGLRLSEPDFACVAHSTGGPLIRAWLRAQREQPDLFSSQRLTHLVMLAPANFGSTLAPLGKGLLGKLKAWWGGVQPGQRMLDWLTLGSPPSLALNLDSIHGDDPATHGQYVFTLIGDRPDRALYDHLNPFTGEDGSDGVVRLASANLNACHAVLAVDQPARADASVDVLALSATWAPRSAFKLIAGASHYGEAHGIMHRAAAATLEAILRCLQVRNLRDYRALCAAFEHENTARDADKVELEPAEPFAPRVYIHDPCSQVIVRIGDEAGYPIPDGSALLTAGPDHSPDRMPQGFMCNKQSHPTHPDTTTLFLNYSLLAGDARVPDPRDRRKTLRPAVLTHRPYGLQLAPADLEGWVHHALAGTALRDDLFDVLGPHRTTVLDIVLPRKLHAGVYRLTQKLTAEDFHAPARGPSIP